LTRETCIDHVAPLSEASAHDFPVVPGGHTITQNGDLQDRDSGWNAYLDHRVTAADAIRAPIPPELRSLTLRIAAENPFWGEERIRNELLVKLGIRVSPRTVGKYMPKRPPV
jgi:hypothetical protein